MVRNTHWYLRRSERCPSKLQLRIFRYRQPMMRTMRKKIYRQMTQNTALMKMKTSIYLTAKTKVEEKKEKGPVVRKMNIDGRWSHKEINRSGRAYRGRKDHYGYCTGQTF